MPRKQEHLEPCPEPYSSLGHTMRKLFWIALFCAAGFLALSIPSNGPLNHLLGSWSATPPVLGQVPAFVLISDSGGPFDAASLDGKPWLASFFFTTCQGPCPRLIDRLQLVRRAIPPSALTMVSFSVDPTVDTASVLSAYKAKRGIAVEDQWPFVTGPEDEVQQLIRTGFLTGVEAGQDSTSGSISHGVRVVLVDGQRRIRGFYSTDSDADLAQLQRDAQALGN